MARWKSRLLCSPKLICINYIVNRFVMFINIFWYNVVTCELTVIPRGFLTIADERAHLDLMTGQIP